MQHVTRIPIVAMVAVARGVLGVLVECAGRRLASDVAPIVKVGFRDPQLLKQLAGAARIPVTVQDEAQLLLPVKRRSRARWRRRWEVAADQAPAAKGRRRDHKARGDQDHVLEDVLALQRRCAMWAVEQAAGQQRECDKIPMSSPPSSQTARRIQRPSSRQAPMMHSSVAIATMLTSSGTKPNVSRCVVASSGPRPG